jgi:protein-S-isoprenylcysteine O-methyltransferase Ste14
VIDTGSYAIVRHPMYMGVNFLFVGIPLAFGSYWVSIPVAVATLTLFVQNMLEDNMLQEKLDGYNKYTSRVRYESVSDIW